LCSDSVEGVALDADGGRASLTWQLPEEVAVALQINSAPYTVMMATPANLSDFGIGFALAEAVVAKRSDIRAVLAMPVENGFAVDIAVDEPALDRARLVRRSIEGRSGCGLCGVENIADVVRVTKPAATQVHPGAAAILKAAAELPRRQPMNRLNHTVHGAAWVSLAGGIVMVREDVGRHNALDKLAGALARTGVAAAEGLVLLTSRVSIELVQKVALMGTPIIVAVSAPTALAVRVAEAAGITLIGVAREDGFEIFTHAQRIAAPGD